MLRCRVLLNPKRRYYENTPVTASHAKGTEKNRSQSTRRRNDVSKGKLTESVSLAVHTSFQLSFELRNIVLVTWQIPTAACCGCILTVLYLLLALVDCVDIM